MARIAKTKPLDIVYILKDDSYNQDFIYSLRTLINVTGYRQICCAGFKPFWMRDVPYIKTEQTSTKWRNALNNIIAACKDPRVSEDFVLFNDDFFAIKPVNLRTDLNLANGTITQQIKKYEDNAQLPKNKQSLWKNSFAETKELLQSLGCKHFDNFAVHVPMILNKSKFLKMMALPQVQTHLNTHKLFSFRNVYGNLYWSKPKRIIDCKPGEKKDASDEILAGQWLSVRDGVTSNLDQYPKMKAVLETFPPTEYEQYLIY